MHSSSEMSKGTSEGILSHANRKSFFQIPADMFTVNLKGMWRKEWGEAPRKRLLKVMHYKTS